MDELDINSSVTLYKRITPALNSKVRELKRKNINYIKNEDIWNYLKKFKWKDSNPSLDIMVDDILNLDNDIIDDYIKTKLSEIKENSDIEIL